MSAADTDIGGTFDQLWSELLPLGVTATGGYRRFAWNDADLEARSWFASAARARSLDVQFDENTDPAQGLVVAAQLRSVDTTAAHRLIETHTVDISKGTRGLSCQPTRR